MDGFGRQGVSDVQWQRWHHEYRVTVVVLALVSIALVILQLAGVVDLDHGPWAWVDAGILAFFTVDYLVRFWRAPAKWAFFRHNIFDLLAIIPFSAIFSFFRLARLTRIFRLTQFFRLIRLVGFVGKLRGQLRGFFHTNGFGYLVWTSLIIILLSASLYTYAEQVSWGQALWWAITTTTTVGYGDVTPHTVVGKWAAAMLMLVGIGFIGSLTSTITTYFSQRHTMSDYQKLEQHLTTIEQENAALKQDLAEIKRALQQKNQGN